MSLQVKWGLRTKAELLKTSKTIQGGVSEETEAKLRYQMCYFISQVCQNDKLSMRQYTIAIATVLFNRFFTRHSMMDKGVDLYVIATACILLGGKMGENPKPIRDIVHCSWAFRYRKAGSQSALKQLQTNEEYFKRVKEAVLVAERSLLYTLGFDFEVKLPYDFLVKCFEKDGLGLEPPEQSQECSQLAWNFVNESLRTTLLLQYPAERISHAAVWLACKFLRKTPDKNNRLWRAIEQDTAVLQDICGQILDLFEGGDEKKEAIFGASLSSAPPAPSGVPPALPPSPAA